MNVHDITASASANRNLSTVNVLIPVESSGGVLTAVNATSRTGEMPLPAKLTMCASPSAHSLRRVAFAVIAMVLIAAFITQRHPLRHLLPSQEEQQQQHSDMSNNGAAKFSSKKIRRLSPSARADMRATELLLDGEEVDADGVPLLKHPWGYAAERNSLRWRLIYQSLRARWIAGGHGTSLFSRGHRTNVGRGKHRSRIPLVAIDYGADQGYFSVSLARFLALASGSPQTPFRTHVLAVEKGGVGGSLWHKEKKSTSVLEIFQRRIHEHLGKVKEKERASVHLCPTTLTTGHIAQLRGVSCLADVQLVLSMLHWVDGIEGRAGFNTHVCGITSLAHTTFFELPHPAARKTYGDNRYRGWYGKRTNLTQVFEEALGECGCSGDHKGRTEDDGCHFTVELVGETPWGRGLSRDIHRVDRVLTRRSQLDAQLNSSLNFGAPSMAERCGTLLHCEPVDDGEISHN